MGGYFVLTRSARVEDQTQNTLFSIILQCLSTHYFNAINSLIRVGYMLLLVNNELQ